MTAPPSIHDTLAFGDLLESLRRQGFTIGVDHYARVQALLTRMGGECAPYELKTLLAPIIATSKEQQEQFHRAFDQHYSIFRDGARGEAGAVAIVAGVPASTAAPPKSQRWQTGALAAGVVVVVAITLSVLWPRERLTPGMPALPSHQADSLTRDSIRPTTSPAPGLPTRPDTLPALATPVTPAVIPAPDTRDTLNRQAWRDSFDASIRVALIFAPLLVFFLYEWFRYGRRQLVLRRERRSRPPFVWPVRVPSVRAPYADSRELPLAARALREREAGESVQLSIEGTIQATIAARGQPTLRYRNVTRPPEYLALIERASSADHHAEMYDDLAAALVQEGVHVARLYHDGDPRVCFPESTDNAVLITELRRKYPTHRVILFGTGEKLIDAVTGRLHRWVESLIDWPDRALLTPTPVASWSQLEVALAHHFVVLPGTVDGLRAAIEHFHGASRLDLRSATSDDADVSAPEVFSPSDVPALHAYLGDDAFQWLCACALYPELHWDLTLYLGALPCFAPGMVREDTLLRFVRLPWFRTGSIPDELRATLAAAVRPDIAAAARMAIVRVLEENPPPTDAVAAGRYQLNLAVQRWMLGTRGWRQRKDLIRALETTPRKELAGDIVLLRLLETVPRSPLTLPLPRRLRKMLYRDAMPAFGWSTAARGALASAVAAGIALWPVPSRGRAIAHTGQVSLQPAAGGFPDSNAKKAVARAGISDPIAARTQLVAAVSALLVGSPQTRQEQQRALQAVAEYERAEQALLVEKSDFVSSPVSAGGPVVGVIFEDVTALPHGDSRRLMEGMTAAFELELAKQPGRTVLGFRERSTNMFETMHRVRSRTPTGLLVGTASFRGSRLDHVQLRLAWVDVGNGEVRGLALLEEPVDAGFMKRLQARASRTLEGKTFGLRPTPYPTIAAADFFARGVDAAATGQQSEARLCIGLANRADPIWGHNVLPNAKSLIRNFGSDVGERPLLRESCGEAYLAEVALRQQPASDVGRLLAGAPAISADTSAVPGPFTRNGYALAQQLLGSPDSLFAVDTAVSLTDREREAVAQSVRAAYRRSYISYWWLRLQSIKATAYRNPESASRGLTELSRSNSPLLELLAVVAQHTDVDSAIARAFQPVQTVVRARGSGTGWDDYQLALRAVADALRDLTSPDAATRETAERRARDAAAKARTVVERMAAGFQTDPTFNPSAASIVRRLLDDPLRLIEPLVLAAAVSVEITSWHNTVRIGDEVTLEAVARDVNENAVKNSIRWRSSDPRVAIVDSLTGLVRARSSGVVTIHATAGKPEDHKTIIVLGAAATASPSTLADLVETEFDHTIRAAILRGDINAIHDYLRPEFEKELRDSIRTVQGGKLFVRRRDFIVDTLKGRVSFWLQIDVAVGTKPQHTLIQYREMSASLDRRGRGLLPIGIGPSGARAQGGAFRPLAPVLDSVVSTLTINPVGQSVRIGDTLILVTRAVNSRGNELRGRDVSWISENPAVATVIGSGPRGIVVASGPGISTIRATVDGATSTVDVTVTLPAELVTPRMAPALSGPEVQVNNGTNKDVNVFVSLNNTDTFLGRVRAGSSLTLPVRAFAAGSTVALKAVTVDGSRTYSRSNVVLNGTYVFPIP